MYMNLQRIMLSEKKLIPGNYILYIILFVNNILGMTEL